MYGEKYTAWMTLREKAISRLFAQGVRVMKRAILAEVHSTTDANNAMRHTLK